MRRKILTAGFLSAILIIVTLTSFATSNNPEPQKYNDMNLDELLAEEQLIQEQIMQKIVAEYKTISPPPMFCDDLSDAIEYLRGQADMWREKANEHPDNIFWVRFCNMIANRYDALADIYQQIYDIVCT